MSYIEMNNIDDTTVYYQIRGENKKVRIAVYNTYLNYEIYTDVMDMVCGITYFTYFVTKFNDCIIIFSEYDTNRVIGTYYKNIGIDIKQSDVNNYVEKLFKLNLTIGERHNIYVVFNEIFSEKTYNNDYICVEKDDLVIDIGFNYGLFSINSLQYQPKKIIGFEPNPNLVKTFRDNFVSDIIRLEQYAVFSKDGIITFSENYDTGMSSIVDKNSGSINKTYEVQTINFYNYLLKNNIDRINYLKVDCEGAEYEIFNSIDKKYLSEKISKVAIEFHDNIDDTKVVSLISLLKECGFSLNILHDDGAPLGMIYARKII